MTVSGLQVTIGCVTLSPSGAATCSAVGPSERHTRSCSCTLHSTVQVCMRTVVIRCRLNWGAARAFMYKTAAAQALKCCIELEQQVLDCRDAICDEVLVQNNTLPPHLQHFARVGELKGIQVHLHHHLRRRHAEAAQHAVEQPGAGGAALQLQSLGDSGGARGGCKAAVTAVGVAACADGKRRMSVCARCKAAVTGGSVSATALPMREAVMPRIAERAPPQAPKIYLYICTTAVCVCRRTAQMTRLASGKRSVCALAVLSRAGTTTTTARP
jgi:hypothetical protein